MERIVHFAVQHSRGQVKSEHQGVDSLRDAVGPRNLGHELTSLLEGLGHQVLGT